MSIRMLLSAAAVNYLSTVNTVDIFGDNSGKALYCLDGNAIDISGNYNGTETLVTYNSGKYDRCAIFNGSTSRVLSSLNIGTTVATISLWFKGSVNGSKNQRLIDSSSSNYSGMCQLILSTTGVISIGRGNNSSTEQSIFGTITVTNNVWHHVAVVLDGNIVKTYLDGVLDINTTTSVSLGNDSNFYIGSDSVSVNGFSGSIDQVRVFNKALTQAEVTALYTEI